VCIADFDLALEESATKHDYPGVCGTISYGSGQNFMSKSNFDRILPRFEIWDQNRVVYR
jgi:hypothetical protein